MENENKKIGFFSRLKIAVIKLEDYGVFLEEKISVALKYFFLIVLMVSLVMAIVESYGIVKMINKGYQYLQNDMADFTYENEKLQFSENIKAYDKEYDMYFITDTSDNITDEKIQEYKNELKSSGILLLKDKMIYKLKTNETEYKYSDILSAYQVETLNKESLLQKIDSAGGLAGISIVAFIVVLFTIYVYQIVSIFMDWIIIAIFAAIAAKLFKVNMKFKNSFNISIYALTLSIILSMLYNIMYYLTGFYIEYFRIIYLLISYVYVVAVILMMKSDLLKQQAEVAKIVEVQKEVHKELNEQEDEEKENKKTEKDNDEKKEPQSDENDENNVDTEPDGSEI